MVAVRAAAAVALAAGLSLAACGSGASSTARVKVAQPTASATAPATEADATVSTPPPPSPLSREPVIRTPEGPPQPRLQIRNLISGSGRVAKRNDSVTVNYVGALYRNGKVFDASWSRHQPVTIDLTNGSVMSGWVTGIRGERVGGRRELIIPPSLAYGSAGNPPNVPPNATLIFDIDLLAVTRPSGDR